MPSIYTELAVVKTAEQYCATRNQIVKRLTDTMEELDSIDTTLESICRFGLPWDSRPRNRLEETIKHIDAMLYRHLFDITGFMQFMDKQAVSEFERSLDNPPPFTFDCIKTTFLEQFKNADKMFARGIVNVFRGLSSGHKTNSKEPFKINRRAITHGMFCANWTGGLEVRHYARAEVNDIDRCIKTLDGLKHQPRSLETLINDALKDGSTNIYEDDYYRIKGFKNSNMHIEFKRQDLLDKANKIIYEYYKGNALAKVST